MLKVVGRSGTTMTSRVLGRCNDIWPSSLLVAPLRSASLRENSGCEPDAVNSSYFTSLRRASLGEGSIACSIGKGSGPPPMLRMCDFIVHLLLTYSFEVVGSRSIVRSNFRYRSDLTKSAWRKFWLNSVRISSGRLRPNV